ncbi:hypothetical protein MNBD_GAMMA01-1327 [hydrothermal vent metagenome]|uniref:Uncharacterized protein n=1 Tax=hydrothermal vent metagenome TaxID=652676 RepID=A0A3B0V5V0_9ZZZZ
MPISTSVVNPAQFQLTPDTGDMTSKLLQLFGQRKKEQQSQQVAQAKKAKETLGIMGDQMLRLRGLSYNKQRTELAKLGQGSIQRGEDPSIFTNALNIDNQDELNLYLERVATQAGKVTGIIAQREGREKELGIKTAPMAANKVFQPITLINRKTKEKRLVSPVVDPNTGKAVLSQFDVPEGFEVSKETPQEKRAADVLARGEIKEVETRAKGASNRTQRFIDTGLEMAEGFANIQRGLDLINFIDTGGIDAAALKIKQVFGVEGADEAELSSRLGKAVLSQLRATFGAQFTEKEGARLQNIEANFGKSTAGNKRLLLQAKAIITRVANRGVRAAERVGDKESANEIRNSLKFRLNLEDDNPAPASQPDVAKKRLRFNPETGLIE